MRCRTSCWRQFKVVRNDEVSGNIVGIIVEGVCKLWDVGKVGGGT